MERFVRNVFMSAFLLSSVSLTAQGFQEINLTDKIADHMSRMFSGLANSSSKQWDHTYCILTQPITGRCIEKGGDILYGDASISVRQMVSHTGTFINLQALPRINVVETDLIMTFEYSGSSQGKKQCFPGNIFCGYEWESISPGGRIEIRLAASIGSNFAMYVTYYSYPAHDDRPNEIARQAADGLKAAALNAVQQFLDLNAIPVRVYLAPN